MVSMSLAKLMYRIGVKLATRLGMYERRDLEYAYEIKCFIEKLGICGLALDIGAGVGELTGLLAKNLKTRILAVDIDRHALSLCRKGVYRVLADAQYLPFKQDSFALITFISVLEHLPKPEVAIEEARRIVKESGYTIVQIPNLQWFLEIHTKWPLLYLMPSTVREIVKKSAGYPELNFRVTLNNLIKMFTKNLFQLLLISECWHNRKIGIPHWPQGWFLVFRSRRQ